MVVCDICGAPGSGTLVSSNDMRKAVLKKGFNPFALGLAKNPFAFMSMNPAMAFESWKNTIVKQDTSDWNICAGCMLKLRSYMEGAPQPTGVTKATISTAPLAAIVAKQVLAQKPAGEIGPQAKGAEPPKPKKRWQFWKK